MNKVLVSTSKGLVVIEKKTAAWKIEEVHFRGLPVTQIYVDERNGNWWAGLAHRHWGQKLHLSKDEGKSWIMCAPPKYPQGALLGNHKQATLKKIWSIQHAGRDKPNGMWIGTEPGGLFYTDDYGKNFHLVEGLWNHPSRSDQNQWFGAGRDHPFIHSIVVDPKDSNHVYVAVSCAGIFETLDGGTHWRPRNQGLIATYLPNPEVEVGHDPHLLQMCAVDTKILWQQNHCGIFRSTDGGSQWKNVSDKNGLAVYGFALAIDPDNSARAWVIPALSDEERIAADLALCVCYTDDGGTTWQPLRNGLPQVHAFDIVYRHALIRKNKTLVFGTTTGNLYLSEDDGHNWQYISHNLARVESIAFASN